MVGFIQIMAIVVIWLSFWSLIPRDEWWIRGADFPRLQILVLGFIAFVLFSSSITHGRPSISCFCWSDRSFGVSAENGLALYLCLEKQVKQVKQDQLDPDRQIS